MPNKPAVQPTREQIEELYFKQELSSDKVARIVGCRKRTIIKAIHAYGFKLRKYESRVCIGDNFGYLTVIGLEGKYQGVCVCQCRCGEIRKYKQSLLLQQHIRSCGCDLVNNLRKVHWQGHEEIAMSYWNRIKRMAADRQLTFDLTIEYAWNLFLQQDRRCALSGIPLQFAVDTRKLATGGQTASLDRIDSNLGYLEGNVQWVHKTVNCMKMSLSQEEFVDWCKLIATHQTTTAAVASLPSLNQRR